MRTLRQSSRQQDPTRCKLSEPVAVRAVLSQLHKVTSLKRADVWLHSLFFNLAIPDLVGSASSIPLHRS